MHYLPGNIPDEAYGALAPAFRRSSTESEKKWVGLCKKDEAQLWRDGDFWILTQVHAGKSGYVLNIVAAAGKFDQSLLDEVEAWAKSIDCVQIKFTGRVGWQKKLPTYRTTSVVMTKEI